MAPRHFLDISAINSNALKSILSDAHAMKADKNHARPLEGKTLAMIFEKSSTRTRVSFDVGMRQLGGETLVLTSNDMQLGRGESVSDTAKVLSRYVDAIMIRTTAHDRLLELAEHATVPVINALTDDTHPCQIMADIMTIEEKLETAAGKTLCYTGDGNNVLNSLIEGASVFDYQLNIATPAGHEPQERFVKAAKEQGAKIQVTTDATVAATGADCIITDTWASMGFEAEASGHNTFMPYQVNDALMEKAKKEAIFMHCLPAHREEEVTGSVIDGPQSVVFDEAENRLHAQKSILAWCLDENKG